MTVCPEFTVAEYLELGVLGPGINVGAAVGRNDWKRPSQIGMGICPLREGCVGVKVSDEQPF